jgi:hypothetical protein
LGDLAEARPGFTQPVGFGAAIWGDDTTRRSGHAAASRSHPRRAPAKLVLSVPASASVMTPVLCAAAPKAAA